MQFDVVTLFPEMVEDPFKHSLLGRAQKEDLFRFLVHDLRTFAEGRHRVCDDYPFGGGEGMVLKIEPIYRALHAIVDSTKRVRVILMSPGGRRFDQTRAHELAEYEQLVVICGHYEGVDERASQCLIDEEISLGDFVVTGGELPALVMLEAVARLLPGVVGKKASLINESFEQGILDCPHFTRPREFEGMVVPPVLLSGNHGAVARWRREQALIRTFRSRPELLEAAALTDGERQRLLETAVPSGLPEALSEELSWQGRFRRRLAGFRSGGTEAGDS